MTRLTPLFEIAIPDTFTSNYKSLLQSTFSLGQVARSCSIFQVERIHVYRENPKTPSLTSERRIVKILRYLETPQYLRKQMFQLDDDLRFAGILPPLRTPHHKLFSSGVKLGEIREGLVVKTLQGGCEVYVGLNKNIFIPSTLPKGVRVTVKAVEEREGRIVGRVLSKRDLSEYWGYEVHATGKGVSELLEERRDALRILTSRKGVLISEVFKELTREFCKRKRVLIVFGGPYKGLIDVLGWRKASELSDYIVNTAPGQATETIRTEEAIYITLSTLNLIRSLK